MRAMGLLMAIVAAGSAVSASSAVAQVAGRAAESPAVFTPTGNPMRDTLRRLTTQRMTIEFADKRLEDVLNFIRDFSGADIEPLYVDDRNDIGLDKDRVISMRVENRTVLQVIERLMEISQDGLTENTWQMTRMGAMQLGPKERLNRYKRLAMYDIQDLLIDFPDFRDGPSIDLQQALQASQGGGGGGGPFTGADQGQQNDREQREQRRRELADELIRLITDLVEPMQWNSAGGTGGTITYHRGMLLVNAPDYIHRELNGYDWWPRAGTARVAGTGGARRFVTLTTDQGISALDGFAVQPVGATAGGQTGGGGGGGAGGGGGGGGP